MFNSFSWQSHDEYHIDFKAKSSSDMRALLWNSYTTERHKLMSLNLDHVGEYLSQFYSATGRPAHVQLGTRQRQRYGDEHFSFWTMIIGICILLDAWYKMRDTAKQAA